MICAFQAVHPRHDEFDDGDVWVPLLYECQSTLCAVGHSYLAVRLRKNLGEGVCDHSVTVNDQNSLLFRMSPYVSMWLDHDADV